LRSFTVTYPANCDTGGRGGCPGRNRTRSPSCWLLPTAAAWQHKVWKKRRRTAKLNCWRLDEDDRGRRRAAIVAIRACEAGRGGGRQGSRTSRETHVQQGIRGRQLLGLGAHRLTVSSSKCVTVRSCEEDGACHWRGRLGGRITARRGTGLVAGAGREDRDRWWRM
jgi:hypothetical protein